MNNPNVLACFANKQRRIAQNFNYMAEITHLRVAKSSGNFYNIYMQKYK